MVQFRLPKTSRVRRGRIWPKVDGQGRVRRLDVYRWHPEDGENPRVDTYLSTPTAAGRWFWMR
jgi:succinate dehydrogenase / fumarate reductase iron-sulfur subunit